MKYIPNTETDIKEMLKAMGLNNVESLLQNIATKTKVQELNLEKGLTEMEVKAHLNSLAHRNKTVSENDSYLGAGAYEHFIPAVIKHLVSRGEFYTAYTPYQPEASQGTLQSIYEYQSQIAELYKMDLANASLYDGASALAEAALLSYNVGTAKNKDTILIAETLHPEHKEVLYTYFQGLPVTIKEIPAIDGVLDLKVLQKEINDQTLSVIVQSPNFFGVLESMPEIEKIVHSQKALFIASVNPLSLGMITPPGEYNADIAVGEGQVLGNSLSFGGPYLGIFTCKKDFMRKIPGRVVGRTKDKNGKEGFVLTLQAREQHIRREKATSNICSNQALNALIACIYLTSLGKEGLKELAYLNIQNSHYAKDELCKTSIFEPLFKNKPFFNEFALKSKVPLDDLLEKLKAKKIFGGVKLNCFNQPYKDTLLVCVTETKSKAQIDRYVAAVKELV